MSARRLGSAAYWAIGLSLALGIHGAAAALLLAHWHAGPEEVASAPAILVDFAPTPAAPAVTPITLPPGPPKLQQKTQPKPKPQPQRKPTVAKVETEAPVEKPVAQPITVPPKPTPQAAIVVSPKRALPETLDVLPLRKPVETQHKNKPRHRQASLASAPATAAQRATRAAAKAPGASSHNSNALPNWRSALVARIERHKHYPEAALARGEHGVARVAFSVDRRGHLHNARIVRSSGSKLLDRDALAWLHRSQPLPPPPPELPGARISVVVPLRYDIR